MATSPDILKKNSESEADIFEKKIDEILKSKNLYGTSVTIDVPEGLTYATFQILKERYESAGWKSVKWSSDQREGTSITFSTVNEIISGSWWDR